MILKNCDIKTLMTRVPDGGLYCYGIGDLFEKMLLNFGEYPWKDKLGGLIDGNPEKQGKSHGVQDTKLDILSLDEFLKSKKSGSVLLITCLAYPEIVERLNQVPKLAETECYIYAFLCNLSTGEPIRFLRDTPFQIPPVIHYCWFGRGPLPDLYKRCMDSWRKHCPDYQIVEWNEDNCDIGSCLYARQAYEAKKYAFVSDYFHLKIIYEQGGIYLDTDVELLKSLDNMRHEEAFCGLQLPGQAAFGLGFGAVKGHPAVKKLMKSYESLRFILEDGSLNEVLSPDLQTRDLMKLGMQYGNRQQYVAGMCIYPTEVLNPINTYVRTMQITENTYAVHHYDGSWQSEERREKREAELQRVQKIVKLFC